MPNELNMVSNWILVILPNMLPVDVPRAVRPRLCPVEQALAALGHRWTALIIWHLRSGQLRYTQLSALLPWITAKVLTQRLREMESLEILKRTVHGESLLHVEYELTDRGVELAKILDQLEGWWKHPTP